MEILNENLKAKEPKSNKKTDKVLDEDIYSNEDNLESIEFKKIESENPKSKHSSNFGKEKKGHRKNNKSGLNKDIADLIMFKQLVDKKLSNKKIRYNDYEMLDRSFLKLKIFKIPLAKKLSSNRNIVPLFDVDLRKKDLQNLNKLKELKKKLKEDRALIKEQQGKSDIFLQKDVSFYTDQNVNSREYMEDFISIDHFLNKNHEIYVLSDGHTGSKAADIIVKELPDLFRSCLKDIELNKDKYKVKVVEKVETKDDEEEEEEHEEEEEEDLETSESVCKKALNVTFREIDNKLRLSLINDLSGACTNLAFLCFEDGKKFVYSANVGDSRTVLIREKGPVRLSYDHKASDLNEKKRVKRFGGIIIRNRLYGTLAVTRTLGDFETKDSYSCLISKPYITRTEILPSDLFLILASDGIWDVIKEEDIYALVTTKDFSTIDQLTGKPRDLAKYLCQEAITRGSKDNISVIVIKLN